MTSTQIEASRIGVDMRLTVANLAPDARRVWAVPGVIEAMNETIARAILAATEAERDRCAGIADAYAEVNWQTCTDTILLDPVLSNRGQRSLTAADWAKAEGMAVDGTVHSSMYHAATNIAAAIRKATP